MQATAVVGRAIAGELERERDGRTGQSKNTLQYDAAVEATTGYTVEAKGRRAAPAVRRHLALESLGFQPPHAAQQRIINEAPEIQCRRVRAGGSARRSSCYGCSLRRRLMAAAAAYFTPTYPMAEAFYGELCELLGPVISRRVQGHRIELVTGGLIDLWSMDNGGDRARGGSTSE